MGVNPQINEGVESESRNRHFQLCEISSRINQVKTCSDAEGIRYISRTNKHYTEHIEQQCKLEGFQTPSSQILGEAVFTGND